jgi:DNA-binding transcriptional ArsR family regulator
MLEQYTIRDIKQLKALSHPARVKILNHLQSKPMTAKQLADQFGEEPAKTSYHVKQLLRVGLVELVQTRTTQNGIIEKYYQSVAKEFITEPVLTGDPDTLAHSESDLVLALTKSQADFLRCYRSQGGEGGPRSTAHGFAHIDATRMDEFVRDLNALTHKYQGNGGPASTFHFLLYPSEAPVLPGPLGDEENDQESSYA